MHPIHDPKTHAERLLAHYFSARGWLRGPDWQYEPEFEGRRRRPDFRLRLGGWRLMLEVKEFGRAESAPEGPRRGRHARIAAKIHLAQRQLREYRRDHLCAAVLRSGEDADADVSDTAVTMGALLGDSAFPEHRGAPGKLRIRMRDNDPPLAAVLLVSEVLGCTAVTIVEHPLALPAFPSHLFQGPWDTHWALRDDAFERVFAGSACQAAATPAHTAA
ncbi:MAG: hypothetical protein K8T90_04205 [Planctomycetes bacterium]|nr:hypothetical protein [Planctomycetota bacterium]